MFPFLEHSSLLMTPFEPIYLSKGDRRGKCVVAEGQEVAARLLSRPPTQHLTLQAVLREKPSPPPSERHLCNLPHTQHNTHTQHTRGPAFVAPHVSRQLCPGCPGSRLSLLRRRLCRVMSYLLRCFPEVASVLGSLTRPPLVSLP